MALDLHYVRLELVDVPVHVLFGSAQTLQGDVRVVSRYRTRIDVLKSQLLSRACPMHPLDGFPQFS